MGDKQLEKIVLSDFGHCYHVGGYYDKAADALLILNMHVPKDINYLKGYLAGILTLHQDDLDTYLDLTTNNIKNSTKHPLEKDVYQEVKDYINAWSISGL